MFRRDLPAQVHFLPSVLGKSPISSFFLVSTGITGSPAFTTATIPASSQSPEWVSRSAYSATFAHLARGFADYNRAGPRGCKIVR